MTFDPADGLWQRDALELRKMYYDDLAKFAVTWGCTEGDARQIADDSLAQWVVRAANPDAEPIEDVRPWLYGVTRNKIKELRRDRARSRPLDESVHTNLLDAGLSPETYAEWGEVIAAIKNLPEKHRLPLALTLRGESNANIARILDCSVDSAKKRLSRARRILRRKLGDGYR